MSYSQRLLQQGISLTRLAHRSRFSVMLDAIGSKRYTKGLDCGCSDGWLLSSALIISASGNVGVSMGERQSQSDARFLMQGFPDYLNWQPVIRRLPRTHVLKDKVATETPPSACCQFAYRSTDKI